MIDYDSQFFNFYVYFNISLKETNKNVFKNNTKIYMQLSMLQQEKNNFFFYLLQKN